MNSLAAEISRVFTQFFHDLVRGLPALTTGLALGLAGLFTAWLFERLLVALARRKPVRKLLERLHVPKWLERFGIHRSPERFIGRAGFYLLLLLFLRTAAHALGLAPVSEAIGTLLGYIPNFLAAVLIFLIGTVLARISGTLVREATLPAGSDVARTLSGLVQGLVFYAIGVMALSQMGIDTEIMGMFSVILLASLGLAFSLAVGLGSRATMANVMAGYHVRRSFEVGASISVEEGEGTILRITPSQTFLDLGDRTLVLENAAFLSRVKSQKN